MSRWPLWVSGSSQQQSCHGFTPLNAVASVNNRISSLDQAATFPMGRAPEASREAQTTRDSPGEPTESSKHGMLYSTQGPQPVGPCRKGAEIQAGKFLQMQQSRMEERDTACLHEDFTNSKTTAWQSTPCSREEPLVLVCTLQSGKSSLWSHASLADLPRAHTPPGQNTECFLRMDRWRLQPSNPVMPNRET